ncbi:MAG: AAA family ATPase [Deltaproteobacteria bacterium]|jgi:hypothetical protein|nr:AAA family ATPase [Deltaproteobacteria bacterium]
MDEIKVGAQSFQTIIEGNYLYADKTKLIYELTRNKKDAYFLSRPRRFGKSLLLSTIKSLFTGPRDPHDPPQGLFADLWIGGEEAGYDFTKTFPVVTLSMAMASSTPDIFLDSLKGNLLESAINHDIVIRGHNPDNMLISLIRGIKRKYKKDVVLLIDEYDDPVSSHIDNVALAEKNLRHLRDFYSPLKSLEDALRFLFLTGATRYTLLWHSGVLNHLTDITLEEKYSAICGFTIDDLDNYFADYFPDTLEAFKEKKILDKDATVSDLRKTLIDWYDGYSWDGKIRILNPYSILYCFRLKKIGNYWMNHEPSAMFLTSVIAKDPLAFTANKLRKLTERNIKTTEVVGFLTPLQALFQTGYLTVDKITYEKTLEYYSFRTPNEEVRPIFEEEFRLSVSSFFKIDMDDQNNFFEDAINKEDAEKITKLISSLFLKLPARHHNPRESFYHSMLFAYFQAMRRVKVSAEIPGAKGVPDLLLIFEDGLYVVVEMKYKKETQEENMDKEIEVKNEDKRKARNTKKTRLVSLKSSKDIEGELKKLALDGLAAIRRLGYGDPYFSEANKLLKMGVGVFGRGDSRVLLENNAQTKIILDAEYLKEEAAKTLDEAEKRDGGKAIIFQETMKTLKERANKLSKAALELNKDDIIKLEKEVEKLKKIILDARRILFQ